MAERRARGDGWCELSREIGIPAGTLKRWTTPSPEGPFSLRPVDVIADEPSPRTVTIVAPSGFRIEGVTIADAITILRRLA